MPCFMRVFLIELIWRSAYQGRRGGNARRAPPPRRRRADTMTRTMNLASATPVPRAPGHPIFGHLRSFRSDRAGMLLKLGKSHPDAVDLPMGFMTTIMGPVVLIGSPA